MALKFPDRYESDYLIIGSGIAGLFAAIKASELGSVIILTKKTVLDCNTVRAQGGIACVTDHGDNFDSHINDTIIAGAGLCNKRVVEKIIQDAPSRINDLLDLGAKFTRRRDLQERVSNEENNEYDLGKEGGHSKRRILHSGDITGEEIMRILYDACKRNSNIKILESFQAVDLISSKKLGLNGKNQCLGAYALNNRSNSVHTFHSKFVLLATGGAGKVYLYTSNPDVACGEGIAMAYRAYAKITNMEFFQFHPTCLYNPKARAFLISEAVRGEGAILKIKDRGTYIDFMNSYHESGSLAPRDIVARAIDKELKRTGQPCVYLDVTGHSESYLHKRFPNIFDTCLEFGFNMSKDFLPVVPAAHYCCGGVQTDVNGKTCVNNLFAIGEVGCTGFHGANRLASNSLLEALVVSNNAIEESKGMLQKCVKNESGRSLYNDIPDWSSGDAVDADELVVIYHNWDEIRRFMWDYVGIYRTTKRLQRAKTRIRNIRKEIEHFYWDFTITADLVELRNLASVAEMIIDSALERECSIGLHYNIDYPDADEAMMQKEIVLQRFETAGKSSKYSARV